jgi:hypothetical protein
VISVVQADVVEVLCDHKDTTALRPLQRVQHLGMVVLSFVSELANPAVRLSVRV